MSYCKACQTEYDDGVRYCKICGSMLILNDKNGDASTIPSPADQSSKTIFRPKFIREAINKTILNVSILKPLAVIFLLFFVITGGYWSYIKFIYADKQIINTEFITSHEEVKIEPPPQLQKQIHAQAQTQEKAEINNHVFETIKKANITKNIDLFMSCYSPKFKSLSYKKANRLMIWRNYDYNSLKYNVKSFTIFKDKASGLVEWKFYAQQKNIKKNVSATASYNVILEKNNEGAWKILYLTKL